MKVTCYPIDADLFFTDFFGSKAARQGAVVRRKVRDVERLVGRDVFLREVKRRGFPVFENAGQFVVFCNREAIRRLK
ncbi:MAG: N-(5'-phosphoribosyl)anthranilate isomerase [Boseongicola sp.]|nr:MAG: N-(5'-phosphoribosyl)anthranilate isomerase [Boseongicola sp.]